MHDAAPSIVSSFLCGPPSLLIVLCCCSQPPSVSTHLSASRCCYVCLQTTCSAVYREASRHAAYLLWMEPLSFVCDRSSCVLETNFWKGMSVFNTPQIWPYPAKEVGWKKDECLLLCSVWCVCGGMGGTIEVDGLWWLRGRTHRAVWVPVRAKSALGEVGGPAHVSWVSHFTEEIDSACVQDVKTLLCD